MSQVDMVIGAVTGYKWDQIKHWVNSLDRSGFTGAKVVIAYNMDYATLEQLQNRGYNVLAFAKDDHALRVTYPKQDFAIVVDRFLHYYLMLDNPENRQKIRFIVATDMRDVVFQRNPSDYLDAVDLRAVDLLVSSEGIAYQNEPWGANNLLQSFGPIMYERHKNNTIINCGVIAGRFGAFLGLSKSVYLLSHGTTQHVPGGGGPDQAALNLLLATDVYDHITEVSDHAHPWAAQLGTMMDPSKLAAYSPFLVEPSPRFNVETGLVETRAGLPFTIVHQWDRVPEVREAVERLYA
jgi:hypothetical protein